MSGLKCATTGVKKSWLHLSQVPCCIWILENIIDHRRIDIAQDVLHMELRMVVKAVLQKKLQEIRGKWVQKGSTLLL